jgi:type I restriction-modification system DNA methylase subunit
MIGGEHAYGLVFEYFMGQFAVSFMQKGGEYFTPASIVSPFHPGPRKDSAR